MAGRQSAPKQGNAFAANAVILLLAACFAAPVTAAPNIEIGREDVADATLEIPVHKLNAEIVNHDLEAGDVDEQTIGSDSDVLTPAHYLTPQAEATLRKVFDDTARPLAELAPRNDDSDDDVAREELPDMNARVPGVTNSELARYRRQMYRSDI